MIFNWLKTVGIWTPTLTGIALLAYAFLLRKEKINILKVE